jgi:hypothetical protein
MTTGPLKLAAGVKVRVPSGLTTTLPTAGLTVALVTVRGSPSGSLSLPRTGTVTGVFSRVVATSGLARGLSFTGVTLTVTVEEAVPPLPSLTV